MSVISGQKTVTTAGTAEVLASSRQVSSPLMIKALPTNTNTVYVGQVTGDVASDNGMPLAAGDAVVLIHVGNLAEIWVDSAADGEGVAWLLLDI